MKPCYSLWPNRLGKLSQTDLWILAGASAKYWSRSLAAILKKILNTATSYSHPLVPQIIVKAEQAEQE